MKIIKYLFFLVILAAIGAGVYIATIDGQFQAEESMVIEAPDELLFNTINEYRTWEKWGPWMDDSDDMILEYADKTSGKGASYSWKSETQGDGAMTTTNTAPFSSIDQDITFVTPFGESVSNVYWKFEKIAPLKTKVTWGMKGVQSFMEKAFWATQDSTLSQSIKPMYKEGLKNLNTYVKDKMKIYSINVDGVTESRETYYMYTATACPIAEIPQKMAQMLPAVKGYMNQNNLAQTDMPFSIYNEYSEEKGIAIFSTGIPTRSEITTPEDSDIKCAKLEKQKVVKTTLKGDYIHLKEAWEAAERYITDNNLIKDETGAPFEIYRTDPNIQPNPAEWVTEIYIPIQ